MKGRKEGWRRGMEGRKGKQMGVLEKKMARNGSDGEMEGRKEV